jgi:L-alanine-DL-glutamate epimerase-like enolase superfamily enzyme
MLYSRLARLPVTIKSYGLQPLKRATPAGWLRHTTVVHLQGEGEEGAGEDVNYDAGEQAVFQAAGAHLPLAGTFTIAAFSAHLDRLNLFPSPPGSPASRLYRRWAFESAALDLALRQAGLSLPAALERKPRATRFVVSLGLGDPPEVEPLSDILAVNATARFKVDLSRAWTAATVAALADLDVVDTVDLKGLYRGDFQGPPANADQYRQVAEGLPRAWIEDPDLNEQTSPVLEPHADRITWDANIHALADIRQLPFPPRCINIKPSRFGFLSELLRVYEYCEAHGIAMYGGGQFELGPGRDQIQLLAALFHPDTANDVAPAAYNRAVLPHRLPASPLQPPAGMPGFAGSSADA